jgi:hypothetical protein
MKRIKKAEAILSAVSCHSQPHKGKGKATQKGGKQAETK